MKLIGKVDPKSGELVVENLVQWAKRINRQNQLAKPKASK